MIERLGQRSLIDRTPHPQEHHQVVLTLTVEGDTHFQYSREQTYKKILPGWNIQMKSN